jgi:hypothetical protein
MRHVPRTGAESSAFVPVPSAVVMTVRDPTAIGVAASTTQEIGRPRREMSEHTISLSEGSSYRAMAGSRFLILRRPDICQRCQTTLPIGCRAWWDADARRTTCSDCRAATTTIETPRTASAGASAARQHDRLKANDEAQIRARHPHVGGILVKFRAEPQHIAAWARGAEGERALGARLDELRSESIHVLHDRRIPGSQANIDHIVVAPSGVYVIDTKRYQGKVERRDVGGLFKTEFRLFVHNRDRSALIAGMTRQIDAVRNVVGPEPRLVPVLCFVDAASQPFAKPFTIDGVTVSRPRTLCKQLRAVGELGPSVPVLAARLDAALSSA